MPDLSHLDQKYFIDGYIYNCPFCNRRHVTYKIANRTTFAWSDAKQCFVYIVQCRSCGKRSMHLSYTDLNPQGDYGDEHFGYKGDLDSEIFHSVPTSFFVMDERIPKILRELITEAEGSLKMNFLTGASACARKAIYELLVIEHADGDAYEDRIKSLKAKHPEVDGSLFDVLGHIQDVTSDKVHEQSWDKWDSPQLRLILETLRTVLDEIYVVPRERERKVLAVRRMREEMVKDKKQAAPAATTTPGRPKRTNNGSDRTPPAGG